MWAGLAGWLLLCYGVAAAGGHFAPGAWYAELAKPAWTPPGAVFGPVWGVLYGVMAVAAWLVWKERGFGGAPGALALFLVQLALNLAWSAIFFGLEEPGLALLDIGLLLGILLATTVAFWRVRPLAGTLLFSYLAWVGFAAALNFGIWRLN